MRVPSVACLMVLFTSLALVGLGCGGSDKVKLGEKHYAAAAELEDKGQLEDALAEYGEAVRLNSRDVVAHSNRGTIYDELGRYQQAIESYNLAIGVNPNFNVLYNNRAISYYNLGEYELALEDLNRFINIEPEHAEARVGRAMVYTQLGRDAEASIDAIQAVELGIDPAELESRIEEIKSQR